MAILWFLEAKVVNLGPIGFLLGCPLNINVNGGQNKFEFNISKDMVKIANFQPKNGQDATIGQLWLLIGENSAIFYLI